MPTIRSHRELIAWKCATELGLEIYSLGRMLPESERFGLRGQSQRAAVSIAANIAEGYGRRTRREYVHFLWIARGSLRELETHLHFIGELRLASPEQLAKALSLCDRTGALLDRLIRSLSRRE